MVSKKAKRKRSKALTIMLLPAVVSIGAIGWFMNSVDDRKSTLRKPTRQRPTQKDNVTLLPIIFEEQQEIRAHNTTSNR